MAHLLTLNLHGILERLMVTWGASLALTVVQWCRSGVSLAAGHLPRPPRYRQGHTFFFSNSVDAPDRSLASVPGADRASAIAAL